MENNQKIIIYIVVALVLASGGGYYLGYSMGNSSGDASARAEVKKQLEDKRIIQPTPTEVRVISGVIQSIDDDQFVIEAQTQFDPTQPESKQAGTISKTVMISSATKISVRTMVENRTPPKEGEPFRPFIISNIETDFKSLKVGDAVVVEAGEDISNKASFEAVSIFKNNQ